MALAPYERTQFLRGEPWRPSMGDPVTVGAQQREVAEPRAARADGGERDDMVALDVSTATLSVRRFEVEAAGLARKRSALAQHCLDLPASQPWITFTGHMAPGQQPALVARHVVVFITCGPGEPGE